MSSDGIPIIRLTVEGMTHSIVKAFSEYEIAISEEIKRSVERVCAPDHLALIVNSAVASALDRYIREEVDRFYAIGPGRASIRAAVVERLSREQDADR